jgi:multidrug efflux pump subunit AcrB
MVTRTIFIRDSINGVYTTLWQAGVLVLIVILVFLQNFRATLVPATTVPVTIIGAFAGMAALGYTVNLSTLFALVLAIGIVVDDAIVIVEGVSKYIEQGMSGHDAAIRAMDELFGPIIGITLVLMAVFLPASFVPGLSGQMFAQFALVIAVTALISAINAATLKPTQCALWLHPPQAGRAAEHFLPVVCSRLRPSFWRDGKGVHWVDKPDGPRQRSDGADRPITCGYRSLGHRSSADRVHPTRRPGLFDYRRAIARWRFSRADNRGVG